jgi:DEAD/DEAH box helicase domain-containing protein
VQRQQSGRAGRRSRDSMSILVATGLPLDQYYAKSPDDLYEKNSDDLIIDLESQALLECGLRSLSPRYISLIRVHSPSSMRRT